MDLEIKRRTVAIPQTCCSPPTTFIEHAPEAFASIRRSRGVTDDMLMRALGLGQLVGKLLSGDLPSLAATLSEAEMRG